MEGSRDLDPVAMLHLGEQGLAPRVYYAESDKESPLCGLTVMDAVDGKNFWEAGFSEPYMEAAGRLLRAVNEQPQEVLHDGRLKKKKEAIEAMEGWGKDISYLSKTEVELVEEEFGSYPLMLLEGLGDSRKRLRNVEGYADMEEWRREEELLLRSYTPEPLLLKKVVFLHGGNLMMTRTDGAVAIDFEATATGPGSVDLGAFVNRDDPFGKNGLIIKPGMSRADREALARGYLGEQEQEGEMKRLLYDIEIGMLQRTNFLTLLTYSWIFERMEALSAKKKMFYKWRLRRQMESIRTSLKYREMGLELLERAREDPDLMEDVIENGINNIVLRKYRKCLVCYCCDCCYICYYII